ncbi:hypothetical protein BT69DRAFT_1027560 [Atractiella rhizophila]|nr:hypothetical protein BT69DRAFT_1027560 [Atractiella rhizophila]
MKMPLEPPRSSDILSFDEQSFLRQKGQNALESFVVLCSLAEEREKGREGELWMRTSVWACKALEFGAERKRMRDGEEGHGSYGGCKAVRDL